MAERTDEEIEARIKELQPGEFLPFETTDLASYLPQERLAPLGFSLREAGAPWVQAKRDEESLRAAAIQYLPFALEKCLNHRGLSAGRSVSHYQAWFWMLGNEAMAAINWDDYGNYGAPILKSVAAFLQVDLPEDDIRGRFERMVRGEPCEPGCEEGCGT